MPSLIFHLFWAVSILLAFSMNKLLAFFYYVIFIVCFQFILFSNLSWTIWIILKCPFSNHLVYEVTWKNHFCHISSFVCNVFTIIQLHYYYSFSFWCIPFIFSIFLSVFGTDFSDISSFSSSLQVSSLLLTHWVSNLINYIFHFWIKEC